jgi:hypothetical protein
MTASCSAKMITKNASCGIYGRRVGTQGPITEWPFTGDIPTKFDNMKFCIDGTVDTTLKLNERTGRYEWKCTPLGAGAPATCESAAFSSDFATCGPIANTRNNDFAANFSQLCSVGNTATNLVTTDNDIVRWKCPNRYGTGAAL